MLNPWKILSAPRSPRSAQGVTIGPQLEVLEDRCVPTTFTVMNNNDAGAGSLRDAISRAVNRDTILFAPSLSGQTIGLTTGELAINQAISIQGPGPGTLTISGNNFDRVFDISNAPAPGVQISGLTIANGFVGGGLGPGLTGGGILVNGVTITLNQLSIQSNSAGFGGGGLEITGNAKATITGCTILNNKTLYAGSGGGIDIESGAIVTISGSTISGNSAGSSGGGIECHGSQLTLSNSTIRANTASMGGGGLHVASGGGSALLQTSRISGNTGQQGAGGVRAESKTTLDRVTVDNNSGMGLSIGAGGGVESTAVFTMVDSTVAFNSASGASGPGAGGLLLSGLPNQQAIYNSTIVRNTNNTSGPSAGGVDLPSGAALLQNTLIAENTTSSGAADLQGIPGAGSTNNLIGGILGLGPFQDNGGPTPTVSPLPGSPAIDAGNNGVVASQGLTTDQRGLPRISNNTVDIGSVEFQATTTSLAPVTPQPVSPGQPVPLQATVQLTAGTPGQLTSGTVTFQLANGTVLGMANLDATGQTSLTTSSLPTGTSTITATYTPSQGGIGASTSPPITVVVSLATTTTLAVTPSPVLPVGQPATFTATVTGPASGSPIPAGTVTFQVVNGAVLGTVPLDATGKATFTTSSLPVGNSNISATYNPASGSPFFGSTSTPLRVLIVTPTTTTLSVAPSAVVPVGQPATFTTTVTGTASGSPIPPGTVTFQVVNGAVLGTVPLDGTGKATFTTSSLPVGSSSISATYNPTSGSPFFASTAAAVPVLIVTPTTTTLAVNPAPPLQVGQAATFTATVAGTASGSPIPPGTVTFQVVNGAVLGTVNLDATGKATFTTSSLPVGSSSISAIYNPTSGSPFFASTAPPLPVFVIASTTTTLAVNPAPPLQAGQAATFTATVAGTASGSPIPAGTVTFQVVNGAVLGTVPLDATGRASITTSSLPVGNSSVTATWNPAPGSPLSSSTSAPLPVFVVPPVTPTRTTLAVNPAPPLQAARPTTLTATVTGTVSGSPIPPGTVTFQLDNGTVLGTANLDATAQASITTSSLPVGNSSLSATYNPTSGAPFLGSNSAAVPVLVNRNPSSTTLSILTPRPRVTQPPTLQAVVAATATGLPTPTGSVTFFENGVPLGTATLDSTGQATLTTSSLRGGTRVVTAAYDPTAAGPFTGSISSQLSIKVLGPSNPGSFDPTTATWYLRNSNSSGAPDFPPFSFGVPGWIPVTGDWAGQGISTIGVFDPDTATWYLRNSNNAGPADFKFQYGVPGWIPIVGDWNGDGVTTIGVIDPNTFTWYLRNSNSPGAPDAGQFQYGVPGWIPTAGDWAGSGHTGVGVFDPVQARFFLRNSPSAGAPDFNFQYGPAEASMLASFANQQVTVAVPVVGDWNNDGVVTIGVVQATGPDAVWYLRDSNSSGSSDAGNFSYGVSFWIPVSGFWGAPPQARPSSSA